MEDHCLRLEGADSDLVKAIQSYQQGYAPKLLIVLVNKKVTVRFFEKVNGSVISPSRGTLVDS